MDNGVTSDQEDVALVADSHRLRRIRQGDSVVAAGVAEDFTAVAAVVLERK